MLCFQICSHIYFGFLDDIWIQFEVQLNVLGLLEMDNHNNNTNNAFASLFDFIIKWNADRRLSETTDKKTAQGPQLGETSKDFIAFICWFELQLVYDENAHTLCIGNWV